MKTTSPYSNPSYSVNESVAILKGGDAYEQAFALQYTSLIIIVLCFIIGAFVRPASPQVETPVDTQRHAPKLLANVGFHDLFGSHSAAVEQSEAGVLVTFASSHDVVLEIEVFGDRDLRDEDSRVALSVSRATSLQRFLIDSKLPPGALVIRASSSISNEQAQVKVYYQSDWERGEL